MSIRIFFAGLIFLCLLEDCNSNASSETKAVSRTTEAPTYQLACVEQGAVSTTIKLPAQLSAFQEVNIFPKVNAYVKTVKVDIGSAVTRGSLLMELEAPELDEAVVQAKARYARSQADFAIDREKYNRLLEAARTAGAVSPLDLSTLKAKYQADSSVSNAEKANWELQETMKSYLRVVAPFAGVITERNVHPGALVSASAKDKPMLELKQIDKLRLQVEIPEDLLSSIRSQDSVSFFVSALRGKKLTGHIVRKSSNINSQFRSERMEVDVNNKEGLLSPGMYVDVLIYSNGNNKAFQLPSTCVVTSTERKYVLVKKGNVIRKVDVITGGRGIDKIEVFGNLQVGDSVISHASEDIKEMP